MILCVCVCVCVCTCSYQSGPVNIEYDMNMPHVYHGEYTTYMYQ